MPKIILGLVGPIASGKGVTKEYLEKKYKANSHRFSTVLRDILKRLYLPISRNNLQNLSSNIRTLFGSDILDKVITQDLIADQQDIVIIDGVRRLNDIKSLINFSNFYLISISADLKTRHQRVVRRNENIGDDKKTLEQFLLDEQKESESEIPQVMSQSKYQLNNNGTLNDLYRQIDEIIKKIKK